MNGSGMSDTRIKINPRTIAEIRLQAETLRSLLPLEKQQRVDALLNVLQSQGGFTEGELQELADLLLPERQPRKSLRKKLEATTSALPDEKQNLDWIVVYQAMERLRRCIQRYASEQERQKKGGQRNGRS